MATDNLAALTAAVAHLNETMLNMGPEFKLVGIEIADGKGGRRFDDVMRLSPSFGSVQWYKDARSPQAREILGVSIKAI